MGLGAYEGMIADSLFLIDEDIFDGAAEKLCKFICKDKIWRACMLFKHNDRLSRNADMIRKICLRQVKHRPIRAKLGNNRAHIFLA